jgi:hypothetical protein
VELTALPLGMPVLWGILEIFVVFLKLDVAIEWLIVEFLLKNRILLSEALVVSAFCLLCPVSWTGASSGWQSRVDKNCEV